MSKLLRFALFGFLTVGLTNTASASEHVSKLVRADCQGTDGERFFADGNSQLVEASSPDFPQLSSSYLDEASGVGLTTWVEGKLYGFGGSVTDSTRSRLGLVTVLFSAEEMASLPEEGAFKVHFTDIYGSVSQVDMNCRFTFGPNP